MAESSADRSGQKFLSGLVPSDLGWGSDSDVYPDRFVVNESDGAEMVWVPSGTFTMGTRPAEVCAILGLEKPRWPAGPKWYYPGRTVAWLPDDEMPNHQVEISRGFWMYRHPVTLGQWKRLMGGYPKEEYATYSDDFGDDYPVVWPNWGDASKYAGEAGAALPTEAEWEYAARGTPHGIYPPIYPWGNRWDPSRCQSTADRHGFERTAPVGRFPDGASWCGALDMAGNVWEWCKDWYVPYSQGAGTAVDPEGTDGGSGRRVLRGGSWLSAQLYMRCAARIRVRPDHALNYFGFRCRVR